MLNFKQIGLSWKRGRFAALATASSAVALVNAMAPASAQVSLRVTEAKSPPLARATQSVTVLSGEKLIGGGAFADWKGAGNLLTASFPKPNWIGELEFAPTTWQAESKDHSVSDPAALTAYAIALSDPNNAWEVRVFTTSSGGVKAASQPVSQVKVPAGYAMVSGGCRVDWKTPNPNAPGNLLTASYPVSTDTWECRSKDHGPSSPARLEAYAIGIAPKDRTLTPMPKTYIDYADSDPMAHPSMDFRPSVGRRVITGGGVLVVNDPNSGRGLIAPKPLPAIGGGGRSRVPITPIASGVAEALTTGQLLTKSAPISSGSKITGWTGKAKDHVVSSPGPIRVYTVSLDFNPADASGATMKPHGHYTLKLTAFRADNTTVDDALNLDGWGDEIFYEVAVNESVNTPDGVKQKQPRTWKSYHFGDTSQSTPDPLRRSAGSGRPAGPPFGPSEGGVVLGDVVPPIKGYCPPSPANLNPVQYACLPVTLWEGDLTKGENAIVITPTIWEYDPDSPAFNFASAWLNWQASTSAEVAKSDVFLKIAPIAEPYIEAVALGTPHLIQFLNSVLGTPGDRPIGIEKIDATTSKFDPEKNKILLNYEGAEFDLKDVPVTTGPRTMTFTREFKDSDRMQMRGDYTLIFELTRTN